MSKLRILALEPYYGGSHRAFIDGWIAHSAHAWTLLSLQPYKWKWRMRHAAITFAERVSDLHDNGQDWDVLFCSDMLNLAEFYGLAPRALAALPAVAYFHENQLTYPVQHPDERDHHFAFTNLTTALAARAVWFNSNYHLDSFTAALGAFLRRMPDHQPIGAVRTLRAKAAVHSPGIDAAPPREPRPPGPLRILWAARWEYDKDPETFFTALEALCDADVPFRVSVIGEQFQDSPDVFDHAARWLGGRIDRWGYQPTREDYRTALAQADVIVSTARHEFFGISVVEAAAAGCLPLMPRRLAYPEVFDAIPGSAALFFDGSAADLAARLTQLAGRCASGDWTGAASAIAAALQRYAWNQHAPALDSGLAAIAHRPPPR